MIYAQRVASLPAFVFCFLFIVSLLLHAGSGTDHHGNETARASGKRAHCPRVFGIKMAADSDGHRHAPRSRIMCVCVCVSALGGEHLQLG